MSRYSEAKEIYAKFGVDTDAAIKFTNEILPHVEDNKVIPIPEK